MSEIRFSIKYINFQLSMLGMCRHMYAVLGLLRPTYPGRGLLKNQLNKIKLMDK